ncbi:MAG: HAD family hydrolase [Planctomycetota bacterium]
MKTRFAATLLAVLPAFAEKSGAEPLPSWRDGAAKSAIVGFVQRVTAPGSPDFVHPAERIAAFDNDGTLWSEKPMYVQARFALDRVRALAAGHPGWKTEEPFASVLRGDDRKALAGGEQAVLKIIAASHGGTTAEQFSASVERWLAQARHPATGRLYTDMTYQPMVELLAYLRENGFKTFIVSGGGVAFIRPWCEGAYGVPPEQVIGSSVRLRYEVRKDEPVVVRQPEIDFVDDKAGKPVGIQRHIGRRPVIAFGNSDGDFEMLEWTTAGPGPRLGVIIHHTDEQREWAYDRESPVGRLDRALDEAPARGWRVVDMRRDWRQVFSPAKD